MLPSRIQRERPFLDELQARRGQADLAAHGAIQVVQPAPHAPLRRLLAPQQIAPIELRGLVVEREGSAQNSMSTDMQRVYAGLGLPYFAPTQDTNQVHDSYFCDLYANLNPVSLTLKTGF